MKIPQSWQKTKSKACRKARRPRKFTYSAKQLFDKVDTAKLKNQKSLTAAGEFLTDTDFGVAVVAVSSSMEGDARKDLVLTQARAMVVREYLVENFGFDDRRLKTLGMGKKTGTSPETGWGTMQILIYPAGTEMPPNKIPPSKQTQSSALPETTSAQPIQALAATPKPQ